MSIKHEQNQASRPDFIYQHNPVHDRGFQIMKLGDGDAYNVVGEYTILSKDEPLELAEKKVMNLITLLNGRDNLIDLGEQTGTLTLYQPKTNLEEGGYQEILFHELGLPHEHGLSGVSQENAMLTLHDCGQDFRTLIEQVLDSWSWAIQEPHSEQRKDAMPSPEKN